MAKSNLLTAAARAQKTAAVERSGENIISFGEKQNGRNRTYAAGNTVSLKRGMNFTGMEYDFYDNGLYDYIFDSKYYQIVKEAGFDHIRLPVKFSNFSSGAPDFVIKEDFLAKVDKAIGHALSAELYIVLDMHGCGGINDDAYTWAPMMYAHWAQIAARYKDESNKLLFEILNEPNKGTGGPGCMDAAKLNEIQNESIRIIRKTNPKRMLVAAVMDNNQVWNLGQLELPWEDPNIIVTIHSYEPLGFTHQGAHWLNPPRLEQVRWTNTYYSEITRVFDTAKEWAAQKRRQLWLSEFGGCFLVVDEEDAARYLRLVCSEAEDAGIAWCHWEFKDSFGAYSIEDGQWNSNVLNSLMINNI